MASEFSKFLNGSVNPGSGESAERVGPAVEYQGFAIQPDSRREGSQWGVGGVIAKMFADGVKEHRFIRADIFGAKDDADSLSIVKARQIIDEQGDDLFQDD